MKHSLKEIERIYHSLLEITDQQERAAHLNDVCGNDAELRAEVEVLLKANNLAGEFLEAPPVDFNVTLDTSPLSEGPGTVIGPYKLLEKIGEGGMAVVYMADQTHPLKRRVALKLLKLGMDTKEVIARFEAERQALAMMDHPHIAKVLDAGSTETGRPYFIMELVKGISITEFSDKNSLNTHERLELFISVCQAVHHAHQKGIIHRDIKPSNIMVTLHDGEPVVKVIDFGIAKAVNQQLTEKTVFTRYAQMIGTPEYMSPEQAEMSGLDVDTRTDVFSLGVLLYELLTGSTPFGSEYLLNKGYGELQRIIREEEPVRPSTKISTLGETATDIAKHRRTSPELLSKLIRTDLDWIVMKTLEKNRKRRYESVSEFAADIKRHLNNEPVLAGRPSTIYRMQKFTIRNKTLCTSMALITIVLILASIISTHQAWTAHQARKFAENEQERAKQEKRVAERNDYTSKMLLARVDWENGDIFRLQKTLNTTANSPHRGFEWYYWQRMCHSELVVLRTHEKTVYQSTYSPNGEFIASTVGHKAVIYNAKTGTEIVTCEGHKAPVRSLAYSPDGQWLLTGSVDRTARIWDAKTGKQIRLLQGHYSGISWGSFSQNGRWIATSGHFGNTTRIWDAVSGQETFCLKGYDSPTFSPDGQYLATRKSQGQTVSIWDVLNGENVLTLSGHKARVSLVTYTPDGLQLVTADRDGMVNIWDAVQGELLKTFQKYEEPIRYISLSPDGKRIVSSTDSETVEIWDMDSGKDLHTLKGHTDSVFHAEFSPDGNRIVSSSRDGTVRIWNAETNPNVLTLSHEKGILDICFSPDGRQLAAGDLGKKVMIWDTVDGQHLQTFSGHDAAVTSIAYSRDGKRIASSSRDGTILIWDVSSGQIRLTIERHSQSASSIAFTLDNKRLISGGNDGIVRIWDTETGKLASTMIGPSKGIRKIAVSSDGHTIGAISGDGIIKLWDGETGEEIHTLSAHHENGQFLAFSPDEKYVASGGNGGGAESRVRVWSVQSGQELYKINKINMEEMAFSPDGKRLAFGADYKLHVVNATNGEEFLVKDCGIGINGIAYSPDGQRIAIGNWNGEIQIHQAASEEQVRGWHEEQLLAINEQAKHEAWRQKETERQALLQLKDEGAIKSWLVLATVSYRQGQSFASAFEEEQVPDEATLSPRVGDTVMANSKEIEWKEEHFDNAKLYFNRHSQGSRIYSVDYAVSYIRMDTARTAVVMKVDNSILGRIYLNGELVYQGRGERGYDRNTVAALTLRSGINVVVFKSINPWGKGHGSLRFVDSDGNPLNGLGVTLDPNEITEN